MQYKFKHIFFLFLILSLAVKGFSNSVDSLKTLLKNQKNDSLKADIYFKLADEYLLGDSNRCKYVDSALLLSKRIKSPLLLAKAFFYKGAQFNFYSSYDSAVIFFDKAIKIFNKLDDTLYLAASWGEKGNSFCFRGIYDKCLDCFLKSLAYTEQLSMPEYLATSYNNIGNVYHFMGKEEKAFEYYKKSYHLNVKNNFSYGIALSANNIGSLFLDNRQYDSAYHYLTIAKKYAKKINYYEQLAETSANLAKLFLQKHNLNKSKLFLDKSIVLYKKIESKYGITKAYLAYAQFFYKQKKYILSKKYTDSCLTTAEKNDISEFKKWAYLYKFKIDSALAQYKNAIKNYMLYTQTADSLSSEKTKKQIANLQSVYELEQKQKENQLLKEKQAKQEIIIQRQKIITVFTIVGLLLFIGLLITLGIYYSAQKKYNQHLKIKNQEILKQKEEISVQNENLIKKNKKIEEQKAILQKFQKDITDSITYAKHIQIASLPDIEALSTIFYDYFLIYLPKSIISGDFYFYYKMSDNKHVIAIADCTGHGVPGALMSILNISILKEILRESKQNTAAQILDNARILVKSSLKQDATKKIINDGMDIALMIIDTSEMQINFAGANRHLYFFRQNKLSTINGNRQPIAAYIKETPFVDHFLNIQKNDVFYMFSDGYYDQLSEDNYSKFLLKNFRKLLVDIHHLPMKQQREILIQKLNQHKKSHKQTDDITVLGFKI
jgi:serine phosphatase RsbU (regulator of sigma subunit)